MKHRFAPVVLITAALFVAACGDDSTASGGSDGSVSPVGSVSPEAPAEDTLVLVYDNQGGCMMMGPNCPRFEVYASGKVEIFRSGETAPAEVTGAIDKGLVDAWLEVIGDTDLAALEASLPPGTCNACVDGVDVTLTLDLPSGKGTLNSAEVLFDPENDFFKALDVLMVDVVAVGELPVEVRQ